MIGEIQMRPKYLSNVNFEVATEEAKFNNLFFVSLFLNSFFHDIKRIFGVDLKNNFMDLKGDFARYIVDTQSYDEAALRFFDMVKNNPDFGVKVNNAVFAQIDEVNSFSKKLFSTNFSTKTNQELFEYCEKYSGLVREMIAWGMFSVVMELRKTLYTDFITSLTERKNKQNNAGVLTGEAVAILSSFEGATEFKREQEELMNLALKVKNVQNLQKFEKELHEHSEKFGWLMYGYAGPAWKKEDFTEVLKSLLSENVASKLASLKQSEKITIEKIAFYEKKLNLSNEEKQFFEIARGFMKAKALRKEAMSFVAYASEPLHREIAKRLQLSMLQVRYLLLPELKTALLKGEFNESELAKRTEYVVYGLFNSGKDEVIATGKDAEEFVALIKSEKIASSVNVVTGTCACPGSARGIVKIINALSDVAKMKKGDVLVSHATTPDIIQAMKLASAIVTDMGGLTCHAAIVSRELGIPCIIGTRIATKVFKDCDLVEVNTKNGTVKKIKNAD